MLLRPAAVDTITADGFAAFKALEYINIIINTIAIILLILSGDVEPPNPSLGGLDSIADQHGVLDHQPSCLNQILHGRQHGRLQSGADFFPERGFDA